MAALERNKAPKHVRRVAASHVFTPCSAYRDPLFERLLRYVCKAYGVPTDMKSLRRSSNLRVVGPVPQVSCMLTRHSGLIYWLARFLLPRFHASGICSRMAIVCDKGGARQFMRSPKALLQLAEGQCCPCYFILWHCRPPPAMLLRSDLAARNRQKAENSRLSLIDCIVS
ncbi:hypothetical protein N656DRAFT_584410 [Canariomyces notabilis]|uniref:Uncharacterized protein n=1 Tax=Canariomyces notabilis TaxID=2074819 RepID=A0AAN6TI60_9PEZI|nr:hypothetical protein N656DRAFT_584410 [Canariomyces arenarius]